MSDGAHDEGHMLAIELSDLSSSDQPIKRIGFQLGNAFHFPFLKRDRAILRPIAEAIHKPRFFKRLAAIAASQRRLKLPPMTQPIARTAP